MIQGIKTITGRSAPRRSATRRSATRHSAEESTATKTFIYMGPQARIYNVLLVQAKSVRCPWVLQAERKS